MPQLVYPQHSHGKYPTDHLPIGNGHRNEKSTTVHYRSFSLRSSNIAMGTTLDTYGAYGTIDHLPINP